MAEDFRRHDISDRIWTLLQPHLPGRKGSSGRNARDNRQFINAVIWILRTGAPWRDLPPYYGDWKNTHRRFCRWACKFYRKCKKSLSLTGIFAFLFTSLFNIYVVLMEAERNPRNSRPNNAKSQNFLAIIKHQRLI